MKRKIIHKFSITSLTYHLNNGLLINVRQKKTSEGLKQTEINFYSNKE